MAENGPSSADDAAGGEGANPLLRLSLRTKALVISNEFTHRQMEPEELRDVLVALAPTSAEQDKVVSAVEEELRAARYPVGEIIRLVGELSAKETPHRRPFGRRGISPPGQSPGVGGTVGAAGEEPDADAPAGAEGEEAGVPAEAAEPVEPLRMPTPANPGVVITRKVRSPHLMPFEKFEFETSPLAGGAPEAKPGSGEGETPAAASATAPATEAAPPTLEMPARPDLLLRSTRSDGAASRSEAPPAEPGAALAEPGASPGSPGQDAPGSAPGAAARAGEEGHQKLKFAAGGETAPGFSAKGLKGLARVAPPPGERPGKAKAVVLVADDDFRARIIYRTKLEEEGFAVVEAEDGQDAWRKIRAGGVSCVVLDMKMPGYHGLEVLGRMVESRLVLPVVVVSAFSQLANEFVVATYPKLTFLTKPASPRDVAKAVAEFVSASPEAR